MLQKYWGLWMLYIVVAAMIGVSGVLNERDILREEPLRHTPWRLAAFIAAALLWPALICAAIVVVVVMFLITGV